MKKITIKWIDHDAAYKVSEPRWDGGDVYLASEADARISELEKLLREVYENGETSTLHRRIGAALGLSD